MTDEIKLTTSQEVSGLTLDPNATQEVQEEKSEVATVQFDDSNLTENEREMVHEFAQQIDITNSTMILQYGSSAQKKLATFSESALGNVRAKDMGETGQMISGLITQLKGFDLEEEEKGFFGIFKRAGNKIAGMKAKYEKVELSVNKICDALENNQVQLLKDIAMLDQMYEKNLLSFKEISMYILAGKKKLIDVRQNTLPQLIDNAKKSGLPEDSQKANDMAQFCDRFEKKIHDLELTRMISLQMAPQIRLVQNNDTIMAEKIQSTITNTIPLWKSQMVLNLGIEHSLQAMQVQRDVTNMTNELLRENAEKLKMATVETAKENQNGIVNIETLQNTNKMLIETLDEVSKIQDEGRAKRLSAEQELGRIEGELKYKLLEIR